MAAYCKAVGLTKMLRKLGKGVEKTKFGLGKMEGDIHDINSLMCLDVDQRRQFDLDRHEDVLATADSSR